jgi:lysozyme
MKLSKAGADLIKKYEGCRLKAYKCPAGIWTIGYGHTGNVKEGQVITQSQADELFDKDVQRFIGGVYKLIKVEINQLQFDALVSFAYNCGIGALQKSTLLELVNKKDFSGAVKEFARWNKASGKVLPGLSKRRAEEAELFAQIHSKPQTKPTTASKPTEKEYIVQKGDSLSKIASQFKTTVIALQNKNQIKDPNLIRVGQKLKV